MTRTVAAVDARLTTEIERRAAADKALDLRLDAIEKLLAEPIPPVPPIPPATTPPPAGKTVSVAPGTVGYTAKAGEVIDGWTFIGPGDATYDGKTVGLLIKVAGVTVRNCTFKGFGDAGIRLDGATGFAIEDTTITDCAYAGIIGTGCSKGTVKRVTVKRIGTRGHQKDANAYGIVWTMWGGDTPSSDIVNSDCVIEDIPLWHGADCHGALRVTWERLMTRRVARPVFITANLSTERSQGCIVRDGLYLEPVSNLPAGGTDSNTAVTLFDARATVITGNVVTSRYPNIVNDSGGLSQGTVQSGNVRGESR